MHPRFFVALMDGRWVVYDRLTAGIASDGQHVGGYTEQQAKIEAGYRCQTASQLLSAAAKPDFYVYED